MSKAFIVKLAVISEIHRVPHLKCRDTLTMCKEYGHRGQLLGVRDIIRARIANAVPLVRSQNCGVEITR